MLQLVLLSLLVLSTTLCAPPGNVMKVSTYKRNESDPNWTDQVDLTQMSNLLDGMITKTYQINPAFTETAQRNMEHYEAELLEQFGPAIEVALRYFLGRNGAALRNRGPITVRNTNDQFMELLHFVDLLFPGTDANSGRIRTSIKSFLNQNEKIIRESLIRRLDTGPEGFSVIETASSTDTGSSSNSDSDDNGLVPPPISTVASYAQTTVTAKPQASEASGIGANGNHENQQEDLDSSQGREGRADSDSDEPPGGGDGMGGGLLGLLAGLSGGEDGQSDLGSLLATVGGIVASLSGDGFDLNTLIASAVGLLAGLLSQGMENPGTVVASYLVTSIDSITGGGATNNGAFFGNFVSKLIKGSSAAGDGSSSGEGAGGSDSAGFFLSLIAGLSGGSSGKPH